DDDFARIKNELNQFTETGLPRLVQNLSEHAAEELHSSLKKGWPEQEAWEKLDTTRFRANLERRWGRGLSLLRMLLSICLEIGQENVKKHRRSKRRRSGYLSEVLISLHARACQVSAEIIALMEGGFADGAIARWRTLHEIAVVAAVLRDFGDDAAERY